MATTIRLRDHGSGILLPLKVLPGSRQSGIRGTYDGALKVSVAAAAEKGKANQAVLQLLAKCLQLRRNQLSVHSGTTDSRKWILVENIQADELRARLEVVVPKSEET